MDEKILEQYKRLLIVVYGQGDFNLGLPRIYNSELLPANDIYWYRVVQVCNEVIENVLDDEHKQVLTLLCGLADGKPKGYAAVSRIVEKSVNIVRRLYYGAIGKLCYSPEGARLEEFIIPSQYERCREVATLLHQRQRIAELSDELRILRSAVPNEVMRSLKDWAREEEIFDEVIKDLADLRGFNDRFKWACRRAGITTAYRLRQALATGEKIRCINTVGKEFLKEVLQEIDRRKILKV